MLSNSIFEFFRYYPIPITVCELMASTTPRRLLEMQSLKAALDSPNAIPHFSKIPK